jgi:hypothetical protein
MPEYCGFPLVISYKEAPIRDQTCSAEIRQQQRPPTPPSKITLQINKESTWIIPSEIGEVDSRKPIQMLSTSEQFRNSRLT